MREVTYRNLTSISSRKKDISIREMFVRDGVTARTERRCLYYIKDILHLNEPGDLQKWIAAQGQIGSASKRRFYIYKRHCDSPNEDKLICRVLGDFYAVIDNCVYMISFLQSFKVRFTRPALTQ